MNKQFDKIRRTDRQEIELEFLEVILETSISCSVAVSTDNFPLIHPTFFVFDRENSEIIFHFSKHGFGGQEIQNNKKATISVYKYGKLYTAEKAVDFGCEYQSVIIYGSIKIIENEEERLRAMKKFFDKFFKHIPSKDYKGFTSNEISPIYVVKVKIEKWFGKQHLVPDKAKTSFYSDLKPVV